MTEGAQPEHHNGGEYRVVLISADLRPYLDQAWDETGPGAEFEITLCFGHFEVPNCLVTLHRPKFGAVHVELPA